ncbi:glycosyltransferase family 4 protein [Thermodesulforhabdus norvegica]|uniref:Uncharacterized protein n=1 Tax=Thermodesulforhabdus norvegica TaxID=39841 RepID=A0A1I4WAG1_9BACT|nr:glycosyltransferase family 4 protein [Thermodesulforhabdus norvegica]SFN10407.1 hypothetical protein SAMN05660836_02671 [Thermodesulforhabdus norvegica]
MNLIIFHYHFLRGGVRSAITGSIRALGAAGLLENIRLHIMSGSPDDLDSFVKSLEVPVSGVTVDRRMGYRSEPWEDEKSFRDDCFKVARAILSLAKGEPTVFWIHNVTLGKNPLVTASWYRAAEISFKEKLPAAFLYHIHDFAECGRLENLLRLKLCWKNGGLDDFYPPFPNVSYAVLNRSDAGRLEASGIPSERVFWLPNVVTTRPGSPKPEGKAFERVYDALDAYAESRGYRHLKGSPYFLMPVRLIRRKNVLEGILLSMLYDDPRNVLITLDATSEQERPYAECIKNLVRESGLPVVIGFGDELVGKHFPFEHLFGISECVLTTSLLEGFGFAFLEGLLKGCPILGRNLPFITDDFVPMGFPAQVLYETFPVPVEKDERERHAASAEKLGVFIGKTFGLERDRISRFLQRVREVYSDEAVDFGALDLSAQLRVVRSARDVSIRRDIARLNGFPRHPAGGGTNFLHKVEESLGPNAHARRLYNAISLTINPDNRDIPSVNISRRVLADFLDPVYFRPLFGGWNIKS